LLPQLFKLERLLKKRALRRNFTGLSKFALQVAGEPKNFRLRAIPADPLNSVSVGRFADRVIDNEEIDRARGRFRHCQGVSHISRFQN